VQEILAEVGISVGSISILHKDLNVHYLCPQRVPKMQNPGNEKHE
jgi:hypothetical protein